ncbi:DUF4214 domain-containing protein [Orrella daihaiensis]|uniref:DUF4214 domain-containing protein n=1 Tax=Orrella daihaiensis TaxID=2782176 RepID=A0ABY4AQR0_9BURK|nr:DUF4214 domain-containing protein [Orrella daihaiensis]UOD50389.1 DUF4214 domain-containing protein [Orrella daihaiensis]
MATPLETYQNQVAELYIVFFGRAPDAEGMSHWVRALSHGAVTMNDLADEFARSSEYREMYGDLSTSTYGDADVSQAIRRFYKNALDREPDAEGREFWLNKLKQGHTFAEIAVGKIETAFVGGDNTHPEDTAIVRNKVEIAKYVALELGASGTHIVGRAFDNVSADPASVRTTEDWLYAQADPQPKILEGTSGPNVLLGGIGNDRLIGAHGADTLSGGLGNDIFVLAAGDSGITLQTADVIMDFSLGTNFLEIHDLVSSNVRVDEYVWIEQDHGLDRALQEDGFELFAKKVADKFSTAFQEAKEHQLVGFPFVYAVADALGSGDTWVVINRGDRASFDAEDSLVILQGVQNSFELSNFHFKLEPDLML